MAAPFLLVFLVLAIFVIALIEVGALTYAYSRLGLDREWAYALLFGTIVGSAVNIPVAHLQAHYERVDRVVSFFGVRYVVPEVIRTGETVVAVNVGGALIPSGLSGYLIVHHALGWRALVAVVAVTAVVNRAARIVPGVGIAVPTFVPVLAAVAAAVLLAGPSVAGVAYVGGTLGTLLGADLLNLPQVRAVGGPLVSVGGAGTFDGIFVTGVIAVLLAAR